MYNAYPSEPARSTNPALHVIKTIGSSPLFLVAVILYTVSVAGSLVSLLFFSGNLEETVLTALYSSPAFPAGVDISEVMNAASAGSRVGFTFGLVFSVLPALLLCVGMWITYATCRSNASGNINTAGLTLCKVVLVIERALIIFGLVFAGIGLVFLPIAFLGMAEYGGSDGAAVALVIYLVAMLFLAAILVLALCFYISASRTVDRIKTTALSGVPDDRISGFLMGMCYASAVLSILSGIGSLAVSPVAGLLSVMGAVSTILIAVSLKKYREGMDALMVQQPGYGQPVYGQAGFQQPVGQPQQYATYQAPVQQQPTYQPPQQAPYQAPGYPEQPFAPAQYQAPVQQPVQPPVAPVQQAPEVPAEPQGQDEGSNE